MRRAGIDFVSFFIGVNLILMAWSAADFHRVGRLSDLGWTLLCAVSVLVGLAIASVEKDAA